MYDVIVVGAGHAGCEAANVAAKLGSKVLLITMNMETIAKMSCNPAMGGVAKGQIVREIDSLGGMSGIVSDYSMMQFRMLNTSKGPAMWSPRSQNDRTMFSLKWRQILEHNLNIDFTQDSVNQIIIEKNIAIGVETSSGNKHFAKSVIVTSGTFMNGIIHIGRKQMTGGRMGDKASHGITEQLVSLGFEAGRMKTGTPPRVDGRSINYSVLEEQKGDDDPKCFSFRQPTKIEKQHSCHITYTNEDVHDTLRESFEDSPLFNGTIQGAGPRYCPSIEDKINRFAERNRHQIFVEPEGWDTFETYINGFSTSLPQDVQYKALRKIKGFENAKIFRPGYAIEYDFFFPTQLKNTLETKGVKNLFFAGQINGTTGYEEAACQGLMAGINAHQSVEDQTPIVLRRSDAYIGVLIDDLVNKGTKEPYRMFTSRAEYRILLRQDNADLRLMPVAYKLGTISSKEFDVAESKRLNVEKLNKIVAKKTTTPKEVNPILIKHNTAEIPQNYIIEKILARPQIKSKHLLEIDSINKWMSEYTEEEIEQVEILIKYQSYIKSEKENVEKLIKLENYQLDPNFDYNALLSLSLEARDKLSQIKPKNIGQATRISGVSPADVSVLLVHFGR
ncbi:tRNA uridine-5-carboxymethylaminomethyl(34) synthesis enzyme MnmG [Bacteroidia bacterium]|nr:tRNA uridine-5-carboxymethylaminomethyl(34) synthesis enzyme MnmG [Bacteroidia bacterium]MDB9882090.1 tRNA uridine-5-carboxymethylaminomethyl(34) synthesis enzyme MnmG [Bacteroidia bacterium]MDC1395875.1 tRNA uridine-5-carboxymethylaminomethyl(34) synthesis enzyme MnmG [Bacteroidia bacterium]